MHFNRLFAPFRRLIADFATPKRFARKATSSRFALPSTGGAFNFTRSTRPVGGPSSDQPTISLFFAPGVTRQRRTVFDVATVPR